MRIGAKTKAIGTVLASGVLVLTMSTAASAATTIPAASYGYAQWNPNPSGSTPGDAMRACDNSADGYGVTAKLMNSDYVWIRTVTTAGHSANYCTPWKGGDLDEDDRFLVYTFRTKGGEEVMIDYRSVGAS
ncbi:hypothetical protein [Streptomyces sp. NBC_00385]|uniref:hypothetical protein n=1 Tax=Streptomyces sp. NBC_00385 TaxID=2975733 RepID=UPI002DD89C74|nr:hypothetical protein [Streptomyces sp. NBC_00385]WRZ06318.1 hypothetical protein OG959_24750 [Streptomyces sp. NBC_00385]